ncbi:glyoxalase/bleomycin resistance protein/dioxygenase [Leptodontidium sp. 2 PMI_412]|nr:putative glyoxalase [Leptodontidium sp. MPI-SDFR-AT-0119]KAH9220894.1 glyoxalase/bleomycin resistance protein/dioxygenase [Leptodontidium sp. 2 PMI_412]
MINHLFLMVSASRIPALRSFYRTVLQPLGYTEMIAVKDGNLCGFGSDYPYFWLKALPEGKEPVPTHIAIEAKDPAAVDKFYELALQAGGIDNGKPGIRPDMSRQPYYSAYVIDADGNNFEAVSVVK